MLVIYKKLAEKSAHTTEYITAKCARLFANDGVFAFAMAVIW